MARLKANVPIAPETTILPSQLLLQPKRAAFLPAKRLMVAVLAAAMNEYEQYVDAKNPLGRRRFAEAEAWFASDDTRWPFSFVAICGALDLDVSSVRAGLTCRASLRASGSTADWRGMTS